WFSLAATTPSAARCPTESAPRTGRSDRPYSPDACPLPSDALRSAKGQFHRSRSGTSQTLRFPLPEGKICPSLLRTQQLFFPRPSAPRSMRDHRRVASISFQPLKVACLLAAGEGLHLLAEAFRETDATVSGQNHASDLRLVAALMHPPPFFRVQGIAELVQSRPHVSLEVRGGTITVGPAERQVVAVASVSRPGCFRAPREKGIQLDVDEITQSRASRCALRQSTAEGRQPGQ